MMAVTDKGLEVQALLATEDLAPHMTKKVAADMGIVLEDANRGREWDTCNIYGHRAVAGLVSPLISEWTRSAVLAACHTDAAPLAIAVAGAQWRLQGFSINCSRPCPTTLTSTAGTPLHLQSRQAAALPTKSASLPAGRLRVSRGMMPRASGSAWSVTA